MRFGRETKFYVKLLLLLALFFYFLFFLTITVSVWLSGVSLGIAVALTLLFFRLFLKYFKKNRVRSGLFSFLSKVFGKFRSVLLRIRQSVVSKLKLGGAERLSSYRDEKTSLFRLGTGVKKKQVSEFKRLKWKNLQTNRERIRFIYYVFMRKKVRKGFRFDSSDTPNEIYKLLYEKDGLTDEKLFLMYNLSRYKDDEGSIISSDVDGLMQYLKA